MAEIDISFLAQPFGDGVPTHTAQDLDTLDYAYLGQPFDNASYREVQITITGNVKRILKVDWPYVKTIINVEG